MKIEREKKFRIPDYYIFKELISKSKEISLIIQWYDRKGRRTRLEKKNNKEIWTTNIKKEIEKGLREEIEYVINPEKVDIEDMKNQRMVIKNRYILNYDPEVVVDEILNPDNCINYKKDLSEIRYLLEIEEKFEKVDLESFLKDFLQDLYYELEDLTYLEGYNNSDFAGTHNCNLQKIVGSRK